MSKKVSLFDFNSSSISITVEASFNDEDDLFIEGYDIGKAVNDAFGDSDYEYSITVKKENIQALCTALDLKTCSQDCILDKLVEIFSGNHGFTLLGEFLTGKGISYVPFSWT